MKPDGEKEVSSDHKSPLGIVAELGQLGSSTLISESELARIFKRHPVSIKRAVSRGELPPPARLLGGPVWTAGVLIKYIEDRLAKAQKDQKKAEQKVAELEP